MKNSTNSFTNRWIRAFLRFFFHQLYHSFSWSYDLVSSSVSLGHWQRWVTSTQRLLVGKTILELGCGPGHLQRHLFQNGYSPVGLDESAQMTRQAQRKLRQPGFSSKLVRAQAQQIPFADHSFDCVTATFPTAYIHEAQTLAEIWRVLKPLSAEHRDQGRLVVLLAVWITGVSLPQRLTRSLFRVTEQSPAEDETLQKILQPYHQAGFQASIRLIDQNDARGNPEARLLYIVANKTA